MTHPHPLTDDTCFGIALETESRIGYQPPSTFDYMRSAADWQLEQVIKWLSENLTRWVEYDIPRYLNNSPFDECALIDEWKVISDLRKAMHSQEDNS